MPLPTWTPAALLSELRPLAGTYWRVVEAQHITSTLELVDSLQEQALLESLLEQSKPPLPPECRHLHYLLAAPFRYGALYPHGSRFRRAGRTEGVLYVASDPEVAIAEMAFYRLLFFAESPSTPWPAGSAEYTAFAVDLHTDQGLYLTRPPLDQSAQDWCQPVDYTVCQNLTDSAREAGAEVLQYRSVRDPLGRANAAALTCRAIVTPMPYQLHTWRIKLGRAGVQALREHPRKALGFGRDSFADDPRLAGFDWER